MRIGELLNTLVEDVNFKARKIDIYEAEKTRVVRVVYLSDDAISTLQAWLNIREPHKLFLFYSQGRHIMTYATARIMFNKYIDKAGLGHKSYTVRTNSPQRIKNVNRVDNLNMDFLKHYHLSNKEIRPPKLPGEKKKQNLSDSYIDDEITQAKVIINKALEYNLISSETWKTFSSVGKLLKRNANARDRVLTADEFRRLYVMNSINTFSQKIRD